MSKQAVLFLLSVLWLPACRQAEDGLANPSAAGAGPAVDCGSEPTEICIQSPPGAPGLIRRFTPRDGKLTAIAALSTVQVEFEPSGGDSFKLELGPPSSGRFVPGDYPGTIDPYHKDQEGALLTVVYSGFSCSPRDGTYTLYDIAFDERGEKVERLDVAYELACVGANGIEPTRGHVRINQSTRRAPAAEPLSRKPLGRLAETRPLRLEEAGELCAVPSPRFLCIQGEGRGVLAQGRRRILREDPGNPFELGWATFGGIDFSVPVQYPARVSISLRPPHGVLFLPGLYESSGFVETGMEPQAEPFATVGDCEKHGEPVRTRFFFYEKESGLNMSPPHHYLADFEIQCGKGTLVGRFGYDSTLVARARAEAGDGARFPAVLARILAERRREIEATPKNDRISLERVDELCPDPGHGSSFCYQSTIGYRISGGFSYRGEAPAVAVQATLNEGRLFFRVLHQTGGEPKEISVAAGAPMGQALREGSYGNATCRFDPQRPRLQVPVESGAGPDCDHGRFTVRSLRTNAKGEVESAAMVFESFAEDGTGIVGSVRFDAAGEVR